MPNAEMEYMGVPAFIKYLRAHPGLPVLVAALYGLMIVGGRRFMRDRPALGLKGAMAAWNGMLCLLSFVGAVRTVPSLLFWLKLVGLREASCMPPFLTHAERDVGLWSCVLLVLIKALELGDTVFVVLKKKPIVFLHWYHHINAFLCTYTTHAHTRTQPGLPRRGLTLTVCLWWMLIWMCMYVWWYSCLLCHLWAPLDPALRRRHLLPAHMCV